MSELEIENLVLFCRDLREHGLLVTPSEVIVACTTTELIDASDREEVFFSLRSVLTTRVDEFPVFEELFETFWNKLPHKLVERKESSESRATLRRHSSSRNARGLEFFLENRVSSRGSNNEIVNMPAASDIEYEGKKDFAGFGSEELEQIAQLARRIVKRLAKNPSRRWRPVLKGTRLNLRRSMRQSLKTGGELIELSYKQRKPKRTKLMVICDVSGSMDVYTRLLLQFVYGLQNSFAKVETFVFSTSLSRITGHLKNKTYQRALEGLSSKVQGWSGGTRIGASLTAFNSQWLRQIDKRTIMLILSDGWDTGEPEELSEALFQLKQRAGRLIWLNPLLGKPGYQPITRGMQVALPFINVFAPAHNLASLRALEPYLVL